MLPHRQWKTNSLRIRAVSTCTHVVHFIASAFIGMWLLHILSARGHLKLLIATYLQSLVAVSIQCVSLRNESHLSQLATANCGSSESWVLNPPAHLCIPGRFFSDIQSIATYWCGILVQAFAVVSFGQKILSNSLVWTKWTEEENSGLEKYLYSWTWPDCIPVRSGMEGMLQGES